MYNIFICHNFIEIEFTCKMTYVNKEFNYREQVPLWLIRFLCLVK